jgi:hypothetical protein
MHVSASAGGSSSPFQDTSIKIFRRYILKVIDHRGRAQLDAGPVTSRKCFEEWKLSRKAEGEFEKGFQRSLTAHLTRSDGRKSFDPDEEAAILLIVRQKRVWPAFQGTACQAGIKGFRALGFHERFAAASSQLGTSDLAKWPFSQAWPSLPEQELLKELQDSRMEERRLSLRLGSMSSETWAENLSMHHGPSAVEDDQMSIVPPQPKSENNSGASPSGS